MRSHLQALGTYLAPLGYPSHLFRANPPKDTDPEGTLPPVPYLVLRGAWDYTDELPVSSESGVLDTSVTIICVAGTAEGADIVSGRVRTHLSPNRSLTRIPVPGRECYVRATGFTAAEVDPDLRLPATNRHPGVAHVLLDLTSSPL